ncbi:MAG: PQQ-dependent sugar dehydrogenase [Pseudomonadota bacterium]
MKRTLPTIALMGITALPAMALAEAEPIVTASHSYVLEEVATGLENPWGLDWLPNGDIIVTERPGRVRIVSGGELSEPLTGLPEITSDFRDGLLDVSVSPSFAEDKTVYLAYTLLEDGKRWLEISSAQLDGNALTRMKTIFTPGIKVEKDQGFGARIRFDAEGAMLVSVGDHATPPEAQNPSNALGTIIRLMPDGTPHDGNPGGNMHVAVLAFGFKNPQGMTIAGDGTVWAVDHGGIGGGEVNRVAAGGNHGWLVRTFGPRGDKPGANNGVFVEPVFTWGASPTVALSGLEVYSGNDFADWQGDLFAGSLTQEALIRIMVDGDRVVGTEYVLHEEIGRIREVRQGLDGMLYVLNDDPEGGIYRLAPVR